MLSPAQLAALQAAATKTLDLVAKIERQSGTTQDGKGHIVENWTVLSAAVACGLSEPTPRQMQLYANLIAGHRAWIVSLPYGTGIQRNDRVTISGQVMRAQVDISLGSYSTLTQVLATQIA